jgi:hypothetical protein
MLKPCADGPIIRIRAIDDGLDVQLISATRSPIAGRACDRHRR